MEGRKYYTVAEEEIKINLVILRWIQDPKGVQNHQRIWAMNQILGGDREVPQHISEGNSQHRHICKRKSG